MSSGTNTPFTKMLDNVFPRVPPFFRYISEQCDVLLQSCEYLVEYLEGGDTSKGKGLVEADKLAQELKNKHLDILNNAFSTPMDREDVYRSLTVLDVPVSSALITFEEMEGLRVKTDKFCLEMGIILRESAAALKRGYSKLDSDPAAADADAQTARSCRGSIDKVYRRALAELYTVDEDIKKLEAHASGAEVQMLNHIVDMLKRREIYRHLHVASRQMADAADVLHGIVIQLT
ncbi:MAG: DUF47 domain-containing protein [Magnetococcales bacterium]|nr:DUF47 domain-containing protein [Magnetococcales bacterium]